MAKDETTTSTSSEKAGESMSQRATKDSKPRVVAGVAAAAAGALLAATWLGVGPAALAGAAGYIVYRGMKHKPLFPIEER